MLISLQGLGCYTPGWSRGVSPLPWLASAFCICHKGAARVCICESSTYTSTKCQSGRGIAHLRHSFTKAFSSSTLQVNTEEKQSVNVWKHIHSIAPPPLSPGPTHYAHEHMLCRHAATPQLELIGLRCGSVK